MQVCVNVMDFHHILPSNTSPDYFPKNNASQYSTPVDNPYVLTGDWDVGLIDATYSSCINTFNNDKITIRERRTLSEFVSNEKCPVKVFLPIFPSSYDKTRVRKAYAAYINKTFANLLSLSVTKSFATWKLLTNDYYFILSPPMEDFFGLWSDVLAEGDARFKNFKKFELFPWLSIPEDKSETYIILVPVKTSSSVRRTDITFKKADEIIDPPTLLARFKSEIPVQIATLTAEIHPAADGHKDYQFALHKTSEDDILILCNKYFRMALTILRCGMFHEGKQQYLNSVFGSWNFSWTFSMLSLKKIATYEVETERVVNLPPCSFVKEQNAMHFVNEKINDSRIFLTCNKNRNVELYIETPNLTVILDDNLRDIFAFDRNAYSGQYTYVASGIFSLRRRINYLYIYSNLTNYIRVGNTESPLLAIVPLSNDVTQLNEKIFKIPMYIKVCKERISQIDIGIYDGAGQLVPFVSDAVTTLHLHFRQS